MSEYAKRTTVPIEKSRAEIERSLTRWGADQFAYGWEESRCVIGFRYHGRQVRFELFTPSPDDSQFTEYRSTYGTKFRSATAARALYEQAVRQRWRALALIIKAKLEAIESGIFTFEDEFLSHFLLPDGQTVGRWVEPQLDEVYARRLMPTALPGLPEPLAPTVRVIGPGSSHG